jgi:hypothetical protein
MAKNTWSRHSRAAQRAAERAKRIKEEAERREAEQQEELRKALEADLQRVKDMAEWEAFAKSSNHADLIDTSGRVLWIVSTAAVQCGVPQDHPDMRIMGGAASALGDLAARPRDIELHRPSIQSGLLAAERLWPHLNVWALARGALEFYETTKKAGLTLHDFPQVANA